MPGIDSAVEAGLDGCEQEPITTQWQDLPFVPVARALPVEVGNVVRSAVV
jgi:hypothetical protein